MAYERVKPSWYKIRFSIIHLNIPIPKLSVCIKSGFLTLLTQLCFFLFILLALQPILVVFSQPPSGLLASPFVRFLDQTQRRATVGRTPLDE